MNVGRNASIILIMDTHYSADLWISLIRIMDIHRSSYGYIQIWIK